MNTNTKEQRSCDKLAEALNLGLECALELVAEKAAAFKGYPDKVTPYLRMVDFIRSELAALTAPVEQVSQAKPAPAKAVQAGFVLVPVEFIEAGQRIAQEYARTNPKWPMWANGEAEPKVQYPCGAHAWLERAAMLAAAPTPPAPEAKSCLITGTCKHGSWCSEVYCQEHCQFVEAQAAPEAQQAAQVGALPEPLTDDDAYRIVCEFFNQPWYRRVATEVVRATEKAHGIGATTGKEPGNV